MKKTMIDTLNTWMIPLNLAVSRMPFTFKAPNTRISRKLTTLTERTVPGFWKFTCVDCGGVMKVFDLKIYEMITQGILLTQEQRKTEKNVITEPCYIYNCLDTFKKWYSSEVHRDKSLRTRYGMVEPDIVSVDMEPYGVFQKGTEIICKTSCHRRGWDNIS